MRCPSIGACRPVLSIRADRGISVIRRSW
jgi:hypothetical protein